MINKTTVEIKNPVFFMDEIISDLKQEEISGEQMHEILNNVLKLVYIFLKINPYEPINSIEFENIFGFHHASGREFSEAYLEDIAGKIFSFEGRDKLKKILGKIERWILRADYQEYTKVNNMDAILSLFRREMYFYHKFLMQLNRTPFNIEIGETR